MLLVLMALTCQQQLWSHAADQSYIFLRIFESKVEGTFQITTDDVNKVLGTQLTREMDATALRAYLPQLQALYQEQVKFNVEGQNIPYSFSDFDVVDLELGYYMSIKFALEGLQQVPDELGIYYNMVIDKDPNHRGIVVQEYNWKAGLHNNESIISLTYSAGEEQQTLSLKETSVWTGFVAMVKSGMWHIYIGLDHILFLLALLLPSVVRRKEDAAERGILDSWEPVSSFRPAFFYVLKIVTLFTVAHTITLSLAALQIVTLPSWLVESVIALSIGLAALHNIKPLFKNETLIIAFGFGLFHGFGFASVLGEVGLHGEYMTYSLLGFNLGVELCQVLIICALFPILYFLRKTPSYKYIIYYGSILLIIISLYWVVERVLDIDLPIDNYIGEIIGKIKYRINNLLGW